MSTQESACTKGRACIAALKAAHQYLCDRQETESPGSEEALNSLVSLREDGMALRDMAEQLKREHQDRKNTLLQQLAALGKTSPGSDATLAKLNRKKYREECKLMKLQRNLAVGEKKLRAAKEQVQRARSESRARRETANAAMSTSGAIAGAVVGFGIGQLVRILVGQGHTSSHEAGKSVRRAEHDAAVREEEVRILKQQLGLAKKSLQNMQAEISAYFEKLISNDNTKSNILDKISSAESTVSFQSEVVAFWELFVQASSLGAGHAQSLEQLVEQTEEVRKVKVLGDSGYSTEAKTFVDAWEKVSFQHGLIIQQQE